ncbi:MAG: DUF2235 domain-containing protein [Desulfobacteraceae bacterium]|nr:DUF2235 domain-containing protein [Desulfobacteraceae bacterium]
MSKKIIICFDGTWNTPDDNYDDGDSSTNVWKIYDAILPEDTNGVEQKKWYEEGVGTSWYNKYFGGVFGVGLSGKIQEAYKYIVETFNDGDDLYIFGFSRGAYSARSLVGLIRNVGLLKPENEELVGEAYSLYRTRDGSADSENAKFFKDEYSREIKIHFLGVWDTVGSLGIPLESFGWFSKQYYEFHDTRLSGIVQNAFHAVAIDEHRKNYKCTLWDPVKKINQRMEQVWFAGAHSNIGGGYCDNNLSDISLRWMMDKASESGLYFDHEKVPEVPVNPSPVIDSYKEFLKGAYSKFSPRYYRTIGSTKYGQESIDESVPGIVENNQNYKPKNEIGSSLAGNIVSL